MLTLSTAEDLINLIKKARPGLTWSDVVQVSELLDICNGTRPPEPATPAARKTEPCCFEFHVGNAARSEDILCLVDTSESEVNDQRRVAKEWCEKLLRDVKAAPPSIQRRAKIIGARNLRRRLRASIER